MKAKLFIFVLLSSFMFDREIIAMMRRSVSRSHLVSNGERANYQRVRNPSPASEDIDPEFFLLRTLEEDIPEGEVVVPGTGTRPSTTSSISIIDQAAFAALNRKLEDGDILSHADVKEYIAYAESKDLKHDNYKRLKYWITNKAGDYSMNTESGHTSFYTHPKAVVLKMKSRLQVGEGLSHAEVSRLLASLQDYYRNYKQYSGEVYGHHAGVFNGQFYGDSGNIHLDFIANQEVDYKDDNDLRNQLASWARVPGNLTQKYYVHETHKKQASMAAATHEQSEDRDLEEDVVCPICAQEQEDKLYTLPCCNNDICSNCAQSLNPRICPYCRAHLVFNNGSVISDRFAEDWFNANKHQLEDLFQEIPNIPSNLEAIVYKYYGIRYRENPIAGLMNIARESGRELLPVSRSVDKRVLLDRINRLVQYYHSLTDM